MTRRIGLRAPMHRITCRNNGAAVRRLEQVTRSGIFLDASSIPGPAFPRSAMVMAG